MKYPKLRELKEAITAIFKGPYTNKFPYGPHTAMPGFRGRPTPSDKYCIACGACAIVCPPGAITVVEDLNAQPPIRELVWNYDVCIYCGQCERLCTTEKGVTLTQEYDLATYDRSKSKDGVKKELVVCECCHAVIAPKAQLLWAARKLGPLSSGNFNLTFTVQKELKISDDIQTGMPDNNPSTRANLYRLLCPKCRHVVLVFNQTGKQP
jgi:hydrogenase-4 component H